MASIDHPKGTETYDPKLSFPVTHSTVSLFFALGLKFPAFILLGKKVTSRDNLSPRCDVKVDRRPAGTFN